ncbi:MAG: HAMP domain-containing sensor histidine kinase [Patescibacteria group bacterium]
MNEKEQDILIAFASLLIRSLSDVFNPAQIEGIVGGGPIKEIFFPATKEIFFWRKKARTFSASFAPDLFKDAVQRIVEALSKSFGSNVAESHLEVIYRELEKRYSVGLVGRMIMPYIPEGYLERHRISYLSKEELETRVFQKTAELQKLNDDLEKKIKERTDKLDSLLLDQQRGTKMLIRRDVELSRANEKLQELDKVKSDFISIVAHQLRTPLAGVKWTLSMLLSGDMGELNNDQKTFLMKTYESNTRMITLVNDMLVADGIQSGRVHYGFKHIDIIDLMDNVLFEVSPQASKRNVSFTYKNKFEDLPQVYVDPETMRAVLQNLLENAIKYTIDGGKVEIDVQKEPDDLLISISDSGIGVPKDQEKDVFVKFFRARNALKKETDGSGLGLYITKTIVEKNGGKIWFESEEGKGSTFYFTVPLQEKH